MMAKDRRFVLKQGSLWVLAGLSGGLKGCSSSSSGYYQAATGPAFSPWNFPHGSLSPHEQCLAAAVLAASPHNTQPWLFQLSDDTLTLYANKEKSLGAMDSLSRELYIGLGCAVENMMITAKHLGLNPKLELFPEAGQEDLVARITTQSGTSEAQPLFPWLAKRHTNRFAYLDSDAPPVLVRDLEIQHDNNLNSLVKFSFLGDSASKKSFSEGTIRATQAILDDQEMLEASDRWLRHSKKEIEKERDGITYDAAGLAWGTRALAKLTPQASAKESGKYWLASQKTTQRTGFGFGIFSTIERNSRLQQVMCGQSYQRLHLWAVANGLAMQPLNQMCERQDREESQGLPERPFTQIWNSLLNQNLERAIGVQMAFRVGIAVQDTFPNPRRSWQQNLKS